jgi:hypothetical protein
VPGTEQEFYLAADLEFVPESGTPLKMEGVKEYRTFLRIIENAKLAWGRKDPPKEQVHPASEK